MGFNCPREECNKCKYSDDEFILRLMGILGPVILKVKPSEILSFSKFHKGYKENLENKKKEEVKKEKKQVENIEDHWGEIASSRECQLTDEDLQILKDFIKDL